MFHSFSSLCLLATEGVIIKVTTEKKMKLDIFSSIFNKPSRLYLQLIIFHCFCQEKICKHELLTIEKEVDRRKYVVCITFTYHKF